jgi:hypothetical protein
MNLTTVKTTILIFIILLTSLLWAVKSAQAMKRESDRPVPVKAEIVLSLDQALNLSLAYGDYRRVNVNWEAVGF